MSIITPIFLARRNLLYDPFPLEIWDPFSDYNFESAFSAPYAPYFNKIISSFAGAGIEWKETTEEHVFKADLPGFKKEDMKVYVEDGKILKITGQKNIEKEDKRDRGYSIQRSKSEFVTEFVLPENARADQVKSSMEDGVLIVTVPKKR